MAKSDMGLFERLPREVRDMIYSHLVTAQRWTMREKYGNGVWMPQTYQWILRRHPIMNTCAQVRQESIEAYLQDNEFIQDRRGRLILPFLQEMNSHADVVRHTREMGFEICSRFLHCRSCDLGLTMSRTPPEELAFQLTAIYSLQIEPIRRQLSIPIRRFFIDVCYLDVPVSEVAPISSTYWDNFYVFGYARCHNIRIWINDRDRSAKELNTAYARLLAIVAQSNRFMIRNLERDRRLLGRELINNWVDQARLQSIRDTTTKVYQLVEDLRKHHMGLIDEMMDYWHKALAQDGGL